QMPAAGGARRGAGGGTGFESEWEHVPQTKENWCGAACGEMAADRLGVTVSQEQIVAHGIKHGLFEEALIIDGRTLWAGGFQAKELATTMEEVAPIESRRWLAIDMARKFNLPSPAQLPAHLVTVLKDTGASVILRVRALDHWIVVDDVLENGM